MSVSKWERTATGAGSWIAQSGARGGAGPTLWSMSATVAGSGAVSATVLIEVTNDTDDAAGVVTLATLTLSGTDSDVDSAVAQASWAYARARVTAISASSTVKATLSAE